MDPLYLNFTYPNTSTTSFQYAVTGLPPGQTLNPKTGTVEGTPIATYSGLVTVTAFSTDEQHSIALDYAVVVDTSMLDEPSLMVVAWAQTYYILAKQPLTNNTHAQIFGLFKNISRSVLRYQTTFMMNVLWGMHVDFAQTQLNEQWAYYENKSTYDFNEDARIMDIYAAFRILAVYNKPFTAVQNITTLRNNPVILIYLKNKTT